MPDLYETGLMKQGAGGGGQYYSSLSSDRISVFQLCSKFRPQMGWGLPIHRAGVVYVSCCWRRKGGGA